MVKRISVCAGIMAWTVSITAAADFSLTIGNPVAASGPGTTGGVIKKAAKNALFAVRLEECPDLDRALISGVAEGVAGGAHVSAPVLLTPAGSRGVYIAVPGWSQDGGLWVVSLSATCGHATAGALVPIGTQGFIRERTRQLPRAATNAEIDAALKALERQN